MSLIPEIPPLFGVLDLDAVGVILFVVWIVKHTLNYLFPKTYTNWFMPFVATAVGILVSFFEHPGMGAYASAKEGILLGALAVFLFSFYEGIMRGYLWYTDKNSKKSRELLNKGNEKTQEVVDSLSTMVGYFKKK